jgi:uncharacterized protein (DUF58 family)
MTDARGSHASERLFDEATLRRLERLAILSRRAVAGRLQGERPSPKRGQSIEFADFRPYSPGDDFRRIDWNAYARLERFFIKLFVEEQDLTVHLLVDASRSMDWGEPNKLRYALRAAGALGYVVLSGLDRVTVKVLAGEKGMEDAYLSARRGKEQALSLFSFLQARRGGGRTDLLPRLAKYAATALSPGPLLLLSDLLDEGWKDGLSALATRRFEITVLHVLSPGEVRPELAGDLRLVDVETGAEVEVTADHQALRRYQDYLGAWQNELRHFCGARGMHYVPIETSVPFEDLLFALLRQQGVLK